MDLIITGLLQGVILSLVAYAVMIPFRLLNLPDLSSEGAYPLGGAVCASLLIFGVPPLFCMLLATLAAGILGILTSLVCLKLRVNSLLAGIILSTMVYSVNLRVMSSPNISIFQYATFLNFAGKPDLVKLILLIFIVIAVLVPFVVFLYTDSGLRFRAVGLNPNFAKRQSININYYTMLGFFIAGCLSGLAGSLIVQLQNYMDIGIGIGIVIHALAALMLGEVICQSHLTLIRQLWAPLIGAILYQQIQGLTLSLGLTPSDLKLFTGSIVLIILAISIKKNKKNI